MLLMTCKNIALRASASLRNVQSQFWMRTGAPYSKPSQMTSVSTDARKRVAAYGPA